MVTILITTLVGTAHDGRSASLTAPNGQAQEKLYRATQRDARLIKAETIDYMEAHGTGTALGDPIEMGSLVAVMGKGRVQEHPLKMGAVKANLGHTEMAAGVVGFMKAVLVLQSEQAPANPELRTLNQKVAAVVEGFPVTFPTKLEPLRAPLGIEKDERFIAGISSFGFAGTIAHALVAQPSGGVAQDSFANTTRIESSVDTSSAAHILFLFTGQGSQYLGMGQVLYEKTSVFRAALDQCKAVFADATGKSLFEAMYSENKREEVAEDHKRGPQNIQTLLDQTQYTQPALFALEWSLAELCFSFRRIRKEI